MGFLVAHLNFVNGNKIPLQVELEGVGIYIWFY
jgi:hypothetical protein